MITIFMWIIVIVTVIFLGYLFISDPPILDDKEGTYENLSEDRRSVGHLQQRIAELQAQKPGGWWFESTP